MQAHIQTANVHYRVHGTHEIRVALENGELESSPSIIQSNPAMEGGLSRPTFEPPSCTIARKAPATDTQHSQKGSWKAPPPSFC